MQLEIYAMAIPGMTPTQGANVMNAATRPKRSPGPVRMRRAVSGGH